MRFLPAFRPDIPFSRDDANRFLPWIVALMVCLTMLMICIGLSLEQTLSARHAGFSEQVSIQIPDEAAQPDLVARVRKALDNAPGIARVTQVSATDVRSMISPWIGDDTLVDALPLPVVLHAGLARGAKLDAKALEASLKTIDTRITLDNHELWAVKFSRFSRAVELGLYTLASFIVATLSAMVVFTAREAMKLHRRTVLLLHGIGADDRYIARQFQSNALHITIKGALAGTCAGMLAYVAAGWYTAGLDAPLLPDFSFSLKHALAFILLPALCGILALLSARFAVTAQLKALP